MNLIRALRRTTDGAAASGLLDVDRELLTADLDPSRWIERKQALRLAAAAHERACDGDWSRFHELCAAAVEQIIELGYGAVLRFHEPSRTFDALSVLWRASFNFGRAIAHPERRGATIHVIDCAAMNELEGNLHAGWCLGVARQIGADGARVQLLRRPWAGDGPEQVMRIHWREPSRRPTPTPTLRVRMPKVRAVG